MSGLPPPPGEAGRPGLAGPGADLGREDKQRAGGQPAGGRGGPAGRSRTASLGEEISVISAELILSVQ